jgi:hypothetical protein
MLNFSNKKFLSLKQTCFPSYHQFELGYYPRKSQIYVWFKVKN